MAILKYLFELFSLENNKAKLVLVSMLLTISLIFGSGVFIEDWFPDHQTTAIVSIYKDFIVLIAFTYLLILFSFIRPFNYQLNNPIESLKLRFKSSKNPNLTFWSFTFIGLVSILSLYTKVHFYNLDKESDSFFNNIDLSAFYLVFPALVIIAKFKNAFKANKITSLLLSSIDTRLIERASAKTANVTTLSFPSFIYTLDNDPGSDLVKSLPATITLIRNEEFKRCLNSLLKEINLNDQQLGSRYFGAINPEKTPINCIDTLSMFANIHLEARPLIERRILGLCKLLPIVDPELANKAPIESVERKIRNQGVFYFLDYNWIDQHLSKSKYLSTYGTSFEPLPGYIRESINKIERDNLGRGTYIWLTKNAAIQIKKEFPIASHLIAETPVEVEGRNEELFFTIKIEDLIPLLANYETIDKGRQALSDFEPSPDALKLFELIKRRISLARNHKEIKHVIDAILTYHWHGYTEKDMALDLILELWDTKIKSLEQVNPEIYQTLKMNITSSIFTIGYPSKHFHEAQLEKHALRNIDTISTVALDQSDPQFSEAWILLAGGIGGRLANDDLPKVLSILNYALKKDSIIGVPLVQFKFLDCIVYTLASLQSCSETEVENLLEKYLKALKPKRISKDQIIQITDRLHFIKNHYKWEELPGQLMSSAVELFDSYEIQSKETVSQFKASINSLKKQVVM